MKTNDKGIPVPGIPIDLLKDIPSKVDPKELRKELHDIGLTCEKTDTKVLAETIANIVSSFEQGHVQGFGFSTFHALNARQYAAIDTSRLEMDALAEPLPISANWKPRDTVPYGDKLYAIAFPEHFDFLASTGFFGGRKSQNSYTGFGTLEALKDQFKLIATNMSATLVSGIDKELMEATFKKIIDPVSGASNYDKTDNRSILLIENYKEKTRECDGLGVLNVEYHIFIRDYKNKKNRVEKQDYNLDITVRTVLYDSVSEIEADYRRILSHFKDKMFFRDALAIPVPTPIDVFPELPEACSKSFLQGIPQTQQSKDYIDVIILYKADLRLVCSLDNSLTGAATTYTESMTVGFTFTAGQKVSIAASCSIDLTIVKASVTVGLEVNFTEQWNQSHTKTVSITVPAHTKAYFYQASIKSRIMRFDLRTLEYSYLPYEGICTTEHYATSEIPIVDGKKAVVTSRIRHSAGDRLPLWLRLGTDK